MKRWRQCFRAILIVLMFAAGLIAVGLLFPACHLLPPKRAILLQERIQRAWYRALLRVLNIRVRRFGGIEDEATLWVGNHVSWLDIVVLGAQRPLTFVAKSEVGAWPIVGFMARRNGTLLVRRGDAASSRETAESMTWLLRQKRRIMLFPEGTSSDGESVLRFHSRLFQPATLVGGKVQAIAVAYRGKARSLAPFVGEDEFLPHLWNLLALPEISVELTFCDPVSASAYSRDLLARVTHRKIVSALGFGESAGSAGDRRNRCRLDRA